MTTDGWGKLLAYINCAWAVFAAPATSLPQVISGCLVMVAESYDL